MFTLLHIGYGQKGIFSREEKLLGVWENYPNTLFFFFFLNLNSTKARYSVSVMHSIVLYKIVIPERDWNLKRDRETCILKINLLWPT